MSRSSPGTWLAALFTSPVGITPSRGCDKAAFVHRMFLGSQLQSCCFALQACSIFISLRHSSLPPTSLPFQGADWEVFHLDQWICLKQQPAATAFVGEKKKHRSCGRCLLASGSCRPGATRATRGHWEHRVKRCSQLPSWA